jgi:hypothetical protein
MIYHFDEIMNFFLDCQKNFALAKLSLRQKESVFYARFLVFKKEKF